MIVTEENWLAHYGILRRSGRYPYGSGGNADATMDEIGTFLGMIDKLKKSGMSEVDIAKGFEMTTSELRAQKSIAKSMQKKYNIDRARQLADKGVSTSEIGRTMGLNESSVRALLKPAAEEKADILMATSNMLKDQVDRKGYIDIGTGVENHIGVSTTKLNNSVAILKEQGYEVIKVQVDQLGAAPGNKTTIKVLAPPGTTYADVNKNRDKIVPVDQIDKFTADGGRSYYGLLPPKQVSLDRVAINWAEDGGDKADGVMYIRPGVEDLSMGNARYAQVRIAVNGTHYLKGMAVPKEGLPAGVDIVFNTNKSRSADKLDALKPLQRTPKGDIDPDNPFGAVVKQLGKTDDNGRVVKVTSALNIVNTEGDWDNWARSLPSQILSKQSPKLAKEQLDMVYERKRSELEEISSLNNPVIKRKLLTAYSDGADASAVHLKAAAMPRSSWHVIMPIRKMKDNEIYAPNYENGERVALIRFPHGGKFEIPELVVNNNHREAKSLLGRATDAVGINAKVAERLSGADFDGDAVLVIPNRSGKIKSEPALQGLKNYDPKREYAPYDGMKTMDGGTWNAATKQVEFPPGKTPNSRTKGIQMGLVSNLITDMTIRGASNDELARAVRHSMTVIDAEKHHLDYKKSAEQNGIRALMKKYQPDKAQGGASTVISNSGAQATTRINERKRHYQIDKNTGEKIYTETGASYVDKKGKVVYKTTKAPKLAVKDAQEFSSGTKIEAVYVTHSNRMKALANEARREAVNTNNTPYDPSARKVYADAVKTLDAKLNVALRNRPLERQAQVLANTVVSLKKQSHPDMDDATRKKIESQALAEMRRRMDAKKAQIELTPYEWEAIQAGAVTNNRLEQIIDNANLDQVKALATPRTQVAMTSAKTQRAQSMLAAGFTQAEVAAQLGVSLTTLKEGIK